jgi:hypothetical protein
MSVLSEVIKRIIPWNLLEPWVSAQAKLWHDQCLASVDTDHEYSSFCSGSANGFEAVLEKIAELKGEPWTAE